MNTLYNLIKRNMLIYMRDKTAVFFSLLSMLIVIGLMVVFLGNMNCDGVIDLLKSYGGERNKVLDREHAVYLIQMWTVAGMLVVNSVTVTLTMIGIMVQDESNKRLFSLYVAPIKRVKIALGYIVSAIIIGTLVCILTLFISECYIALTGGDILHWVQILKILGLIILNVSVYACIMFFVAMFVHSDSAWSGLGTIVGTLVGFVGAIYLPMGMLPEAVQNVLKWLPFLHGTSMMRKVFTEDALEITFKGLPEQVIDGYQTSMGIYIEANGEVMNNLIQIACIIGFGVVALTIATLILRKRAIGDR